MSAGGSGWLQLLEARLRTVTLTVCRRRALFRGPRGRSERNRTQESAGAKRDDETRKALLDSAMNLIQKAALQPGGENFRLAIQKLNQYFEGTSRAEYQLESAAREYLNTQMPPKCRREPERADLDGSRHAAH